mgnify:CR=1 FL=1
MSSHASTTHAISLNPATGKVFAEYPFEQAAELEQSLSRAAAGFKAWRKQPISARAEQLRTIAKVLRKNAEAMAQMMTAEMGKPIAQSRGEVEKTAVTCEWYAENGPAMLAPEKTPVENDKAYIDYLPLGPVLAVMPWNFPIWHPSKNANGLAPRSQAQIGSLFPPVSNSRRDSIPAQWHPSSDSPESVSRRNPSHDRSVRLPSSKLEETPPQDKHSFNS